MRLSMLIPTYPSTGITSGKCGDLTSFSCPWVGLLLVIFLVMKTSSVMVKVAKRYHNVIETLLLYFKVYFCP